LQPVSSTVEKGRMNEISVTTDQWPLFVLDVILPKDYLQSLTPTLVTTNNTPSFSYLVAAPEGVDEQVVFCGTKWYMAKLKLEEFTVNGLISHYAGLCTSSRRGTVFERVYEDHSTLGHGGNPCVCPDTRQYAFFDPTA